MSHPTITSLELVTVDHDDDGTAALHFRPVRPLAFTAGQHGLWLVPGGGGKPLTIASAPEEERVTVGTVLHRGSRFKRALGALEVGSRVRLLGPIGGFTLERARPEVVMLAQGTGVTPFRSMLRHVAVTGDRRRTTLVHVGARHPFAADTATATGAASYPTTQEEFRLAVRGAARDQRDATFMVSGSPGFVRSTTALLTEELVDPAQVLSDRFYGYRAPTTAERPTPVSA